MGGHFGMPIVMQHAKRWELKQQKFSCCKLCTYCVQTVSRSGVLDLSTLTVSHIHCPPPPWHSVEGEGDCVLRRAVLLHRKPTWLSAHSIYTCPSFSSSKIKLLDFNPGQSSPHKIEAPEDEALAKHVEVSTSVPVTTLAAHPLNDEFVAGTMEAAILVFGDKREPTTSENEI
ncbi:hypothetical protein L7F22_046962 [Adiantum nelumboides]|nr:hypothetical protein [Adiantum nelumboides]